MVLWNWNHPRRHLPLSSGPLAPGAVSVGKAGAAAILRLPAVAPGALGSASGGPQNAGAAPSRVHSFLTGRLSRAWVCAVSAQRERCNRTQRVEEAPGSPSGHSDLKNLSLLRVTPLERGTANTLPAPSSQSPSYNNSKDKKRHCWKGLHVEGGQAHLSPCSLCSLK